jgi:hypothetical protein
MVSNLNEISQSASDAPLVQPTELGQVSQQRLMKNEHNNNCILLK